jgi:hypothetical protein
VAGCHPVAASLMLIVMERSRCASCSRPSRSDGPHTTGPGPDCSDHPAPATRGGLPRWALAAVVVGRARLLSVVQRPVSCAPHSPRSPALLCSPRRHARSHSNHAAHGGCQGKPCHEAAALLPAAGRGRGGGLAAQRLHTQCVVQGGPTCSKGGARALRHPCCCCSPRCCARRVARVPPQAASLGELHQALRAGFAPERVVFDSPAKTVAELRCVRACAANAVCCRQAPCAPPPPRAPSHGTANASVLRVPRPPTATRCRRGLPSTWTTSRSCSVRQRWWRPSPACCSTATSSSLGCASTRRCAGACVRELRVRSALAAVSRRCARRAAAAALAQALSRAHTHTHTHTHKRRDQWRRCGCDAGWRGLHCSAVHRRPCVQVWLPIAGACVWCSRWQTGINSWGCQRPACRHAAPLSCRAGQCALGTAMHAMHEPCVQLSYVRVLL